MPSLPIEDDLVCAEDGFTYFWPDGAKGFFASHELRQIADQLDEINAPWQEFVNEHILPRE